MIIKINNIEYEVDPTTGVVGDWHFWDDVNAGIFEPHTFKVFDRFLDKDHSYIDIGSWIGPTCLYGSQLSKQCYAFEPDSVAFNQLNINLNLNKNIKNIKAFQKAIGPINGIIQMGSNSQQGDSMSSILFKDKNGWDVESITLQSFFEDNHLNDCNFIKMDVEGAEKIILPSIKNTILDFKPTLYLALHTGWMQDQKEFLDIVKETVSFYKNVYTNSGKLLNHLSEIDHLPLMTEIVATDLNW